jgi:hypothetical protein
VKFVQIMEMQTTRFDEIDALDQQWQKATAGRNTVVRQSITKDRDRPDTYMIVVEFDSYDDAMRNNELPETAEIAQQLAKLVDGEVTFRNLDVIHE